MPKKISNQFASKVLMIRPTCFYLNQATFKDNKFMKKTNITKKISTQKARKEWTAMKRNITKSGVEVVMHDQ